jgi:hypothetical protein
MRSPFAAKVTALLQERYLGICNLCLRAFRESELCFSGVRECRGRPSGNLLDLLALFRIPS